MTICLGSSKEPVHHQGRVLSISVGDNGYPQLLVEHIPIFAPDWGFLGWYQQCMREAHRAWLRTSDEQAYLQACITANDAYMREYLALMEKRLPLIATWLRGITPTTDLTLVCFCTRMWHQAGQERTRFCHRDFIARIIAECRPDIPLSRH